MSTPLRTRDLLILSGLPIAFVLAASLMRVAAGPFWSWFNIDPDYFYLLDALHVASFQWPGHVAHPGTTMHVFGGMILRAMHPLLSNADLQATVLSNPELYLGRIGQVLLAINAAALFLVGVIARRVMGHMLPALMMHSCSVAPSGSDHMLSPNSAPLARSVAAPVLGSTQ